jgi:hypothetical protein
MSAFAIVIGVLGVLGCVEVPDNIRAQFAAPGANDRTNYRPGHHGTEPPPVAKASTTSTTSATSADADAAVVPTSESDAGAP